MNITIQLNGRDHPISGSISVLELLRTLDVNPGSVVVERNRSILERDTLDQVTLQQGDEVELIRFVGGG